MTRKSDQHMDFKFSGRRGLYYEQATEPYFQDGLGVARTSREHGGSVSPSMWLKPGPTSRQEKGPAPGIGEPARKGPRHEARHPCGLSGVSGLLQTSTIDRQSYACPFDRVGSPEGQCPGGAQAYQVSTLFVCSQNAHLFDAFGSFHRNDNMLVGISRLDER